MIIRPDDHDLFDKLGGKARALAELGSGFNIPEWFAVSDLVADDRVLKEADRLGASSFAVRSSAKSEDGKCHSFAGQYDTFLYVGKDELIQRISDVIESGNSDRLEAYQKSREIGEKERPVALVQKMLSPHVSGVAFSADPVSGDRSTVVISALWGTGSAVVSGEADADSWSVRDGRITTRLASKTQQHVRSASEREGVVSIPVPKEKRDVACLTEAQVREVAALARECEARFGSPQDIEWAIEDGDLYLLQSRPITTLGEPGGELIVWDNSNIAESYSGITSPMTFSFAMRAYEHVYREFCRILSVPSNRLEKHDAVFPEMLGHIRGHVFYNLNSWYQVLAMLPGFSINRGFMEQMMGVKQPMPEEVIESILARTRTNPFADSLALCRTMFGLVWHDRKIDRTIEAFYSRLDDALSLDGKSLESMDEEALVRHYRELEERLLKRWDAPLINDFLAMIYYGVLRSLSGKWLGDESVSNQLLLDCGEIISAEPPRRIAAMAELIHDHPGDAELLASSSESVARKREVIAGHPDLQGAFDSYLEKFGDRCMEELKLESSTLVDDPSSLLSSIGAMALRENPAEGRGGSLLPDPVEWDLKGPGKRVFEWVLRQARKRVRDRENLRFERTRLFGRVRRIVVELGKRLHASGKIENAKDVFFLTIPELMLGAAPPENLRSLVAQRAEEKEAFNVPPPDRFHTRGDIEESTPLVSELQEESTKGADLTGIGACPGVVRGKVRVVKSPAEARLEEGEILVAQQTDPGWVVLFPAASGLLVERGSLLSHSAIVARELQLPCVVSIPNVTTRIKTGDLVEMNGSTGTVVFLSGN